MISVRGSIASIDMKATWEAGKVKASPGLLEAAAELSGDLYVHPLLPQAKAGTKTAESFVVTMASVMDADTWTVEGLPAPPAGDSSSVTDSGEKPLKITPQLAKKALRSTLKK